MAEIEETRVETATLDFDAVRAGDGERTALLLHGFPDDARTFVPLMERLADEGYTAVAPYMRGYGGTDTPPLDTSNYSVMSLGQDMLALIDALDAEDPLVVGHDWGATAVTAVSAMDASSVSECVVMAVPPNVVEVFNEYPSQTLRSWYMTFFQIPGLAEETLRRDDFALVERLWNLWSPNWDYTDERIDEVRETFRAENTVEAALLYYRALFEDALSVPADSMRVAGIEAPTLLVGGRNDGCITPRAFEDAEDCYEGRFELEMVGGAGHFMHAEKPDAVADAVLEFVEG
ncbi:MAG: alpha/beta hydrolase [Halobacteriales archaeon]|nr:alpha/beta hydrolase [Halobacteriales archaeon]